MFDLLTQLGKAVWEYAERPEVEKKRLESLNNHEPAGAAAWSSMWAALTAL